MLRNFPNVHFYYINLFILSVLDSSFIEEVKVFVEHIFSKENLILPGVITNGEHIYDTLLSVDKKRVDDSLSFLNVSNLIKKVI